MTARVTKCWRRPTISPSATRSPSSPCCFPPRPGPCEKASLTMVGYRKPRFLPWFISSDSARRIPMLDRRQLFPAMAAAPLAAREAAAAPAQILRVAMTASDLTTVTGIPNNGGEGFRFLGFPAYDGLVNWDYYHVDQTADAIPGLFESWTVDVENPTRWIFSLRQGVVFHDGSPL